MAFSLTQRGTKSTTGLSAGTSLSPTISSTATLGNALILNIAVDKNATAFGSISGWTIANSSINTDASFAQYFKVSDGTETGATVTWTASQFAIAWIEEWGGWSGTPTLDTGAVSTNYSSSAVDQISTGTTPTTSLASSLALAICAIDTGYNFTSPTMTNSFTTGLLDYDNPPTGAPGLATAYKELTTVQTVETTFDFNASDSDQMGAGLIVIGDLQLSPVACLLGFGL